ncbi:unnamed protein product [Polarella glacialis]|uniref:FHA domain-containing protein n=1 Tax=Polarella glacialis TaxID=89957 RepID=A0A813IJI3_POLGL|nr:unnamed protein product [Polarella glacialis]
MALKNFGLSGSSQGMPRLKLPAFFSPWRSKVASDKRRPEQPASERDSSQLAPRLAWAVDASCASNGCSADASDVCSTLARLCTGSQAPALFRCLGGSVDLICETLNGNEVPMDAVSTLTAAAEFLAAGESCDQHLEFLLLAHSDKAAMHGFVREMEGTLSVLCKSPSLRGIAPPLQDALGQWRSDIEVFQERCREAWELHAYFVFLDLKGDQTLLKLVAKQLMGLLETSPRGLIANLARTSPWVESAFEILASKGERAMLEQRHEQALQTWLASVMVNDKENAMLQGDGQQFWDAYFCNFYKITWPDFEEAFQQYFIHQSGLPQDIQERLRARTAIASRHHVARHVWDSLLETSGRPMALLEGLVKEVLLDLPATIYSNAPASKSRSKSFGGIAFGSEFSSLGKSSVPQVTDLPGSTQRPPGLAWGPDSEKSSSAASLAAPGVLMVDLPTTVPVGAHRPRTSGTITAQDPRLRMGPIEPGPRMEWDRFVAHLCTNTRPWWVAHGEPLTDMLPGQQDPTQVQALRSVNSSIIATRKALILRVASGDLAHNCPVLDIPASAAVRREVESHPALGTESKLPAIVITPNSTRFSCVTKFGRATHRQTLLPDLVMKEPIASRSHFNVVYEPKTDRYQVMDAGSKWGTFIKYETTGKNVSCGDWIRIGNAELVIRYCGGGCKRHSQHAHYRLHSLSVARSVYGGSSFGLMQPSRRPGFGLMQSAFEDKDDDVELLESEEQKQGASGRYEQCVTMLAGGSVPAAFSSSFEKMCYQAHAMQASKPGEKTRMNSNPTSVTSSGSPRKPPMSLPVQPLEIDFLSGPRMGQRVMVTDKVCTVGRGDSSTIQISDPMLTNVSRTHCIFTYVGNRWQISDNKSTNGTWRRLSCVLEPSEPIDVSTGESFLAGAHELHVEEVEMSRWWIPSSASVVLKDLQQEHREVTSHHVDGRRSASRSGNKAGSHAQSSQ